jgi:phage terminase large subunit-like protein
MTTFSLEFEPQTWPAWVGAWPRLTGRQEPAEESSFEGDESQGDRAAQLAARVDKRTMPWQWMSLCKILSRRDDGLWTHPDVVLICPRQGGKTLIIILRILFGLFILNEQIVYSAQRWVTAKAVYERVKSIVEKTPSLHRRLAKDPTASSSQGEIVLKSGARVAFGVRSGDLGRGLDRIDLVVFDEAYNLTEDEVASLAGSQLAAPSSQTIYASTAPVADRHPNCFVLAGMRRLGLAGTPDLYFAEWRAPEGMSRDDPEAYRLANPSYGVIQKERDLERIRNKATSLPALALFDADYLGWGDYPRDQADIAAIIPAELWQAMTNRAPRLTGPCTLALDRSPDRQTWALAAAQRAADGRIHLEIGKFEALTNNEMAEYIERVAADWNPMALIIDAKSAAAAIKPLLAEAGIEAEMTNATQLALACGGFLDDALAGHLSHCDQQVLNDAIASVTKRVMPGGGFAWDRAADGSIAPIVAATLAHWGLLEFGRVAVRQVAGPAFSETNRADDDDFARRLAPVAAGRSTAQVVTEP